MIKKARKRLYFSKIINFNVSIPSLYGAIWLTKTIKSFYRVYDKWFIKLYCLINI